MSRFFLLTDNLGKRHFVNVEHITRVTEFTNAPNPYVYIGFSDGKEGLYLPTTDFDSLTDRIRRGAYYE